MTPRTNRSMKRPMELNHVKEEAPNWVIILGGALLSTLSIRLCCKLKQVFDFRRARKNHAPSKENENSTPTKRRESCKFHSQLYCFIPDEDGCYQCLSGSKHTPLSPMSKNGDDTLPLVKVSSTESSNENGAPDHLYLLPNSSDSTCTASECGSDIYSKREVVQKLRRQVKRRDDMIFEMQVQIKNLQNSLTFQIDHNTHLQALLDSSNQQLCSSEREIHRLRKTTSDRLEEEETRSSEGREKEWIEMLKRQVKELKEVIEGKEFLIKNYKDEEMELCLKLKELQLRLGSQASLPNIL